MEGGGHLVVIRRRQHQDHRSWEIRARAPLRRSHTPSFEALDCRRRLFKDTPTSSDQSLHHVAHPDVVLLDHRTLKIEGLLDLIDLAPSPLTHLDRRNRLPETVAQPQPRFADP